MPYKNPELHRAELNANARKWKQNNKAKKAAADKVYYEKNKVQIAVQKKEWGQANQSKKNASTKRYKETKRDNNYIVTELDKFVEQEMYELAQIRTKTLGKDWHVDHTIPLSKGGPHAIHNLEVVPKAWNLSKGNRNSNRYREVL